MPISWPPPMRMPFTRQMTGLSQARIALDHVVEEAHVLPVLLRVAGVVLGVLLGVAAGAEGAVAGAGEDDAATSRAFDARRGTPRITPFTMSVVYELSCAGLSSVIHAL